MQDNALIKLFLPIIKAGLVSRGYTAVKVKQAYEPTQQGINTLPTVYFFKTGDHRYGSVRRVDAWNELLSQMEHIETQVYETSFQISALVIQDPLDTSSYTASDLVNIVAEIMQSSTTLETLFSSGVGIYRITDVRNPYFMDDKDRFEASPSFDFTLVHKQVSVTVNPMINSVQYGIFRV